MSAVICVIVKNEDLTLDEWICYHQKLGFDHIYIYDNSPEYSLSNWEERYNGFITVTHFPGAVQQRPAYNQWLAKYRNMHTWCAFIDADEFIVLKKHGDIKALLAEHCTSGALCLNWVLFGSSGHTKYTSEPVLKRFTWRCAQVNEHVKSIAHLPSTVQVSVHEVITCQGCSHDTNNQPVHGPFNHARPDDVAIIHHYVLKSLEEYQWKVARGRADINLPRNGMDVWNAIEPIANQTQDLSVCIDGIPSRRNPICSNKIL